MGGYSHSLLTCLLPHVIASTAVYNWLTETTDFQRQCCQTVPAGDKEVNAPHTNFGNKLLIWKHVHICNPHMLCTTRYQKLRPCFALGEKYDPHGWAKRKSSLSIEAWETFPQCNTNLKSSNTYSFKRDGRYHASPRWSRSCTKWGYNDSYNPRSNNLINAYTNRCSHTSTAPETNR